jgi:hypothetical protein
MESVETAAFNYVPDILTRNKKLLEDIKADAFKAGAKFREEQFLNVLKAIAGWAGNLPDERLTTKTGPNDAAARGEMIVSMRQIAIEVIRKFQPDYKPF